MHALDLNTVTWRRSSYSNSTGGQCVEVGINGATPIPVRDSKTPATAVLSIPSASWSAFLTATKDSADWRRSSHSNQDGGQCVEVATNLSTTIPVRDSKTPDTALLVPRPGWSAFVSAVKGGALHA